MPNDPKEIDAEQPTPEEPEEIVDFSQDEQKKHWLKVRDWAQENVDRLEEELKDYKAKLKEAEEQFLEDTPANWAYIKINGIAVYSRERKPGQKRVSVPYIREKYPDIAREATEQNYTYPVKRIR